MDEMLKNKIWLAFVVSFGIFSLVILWLQPSIQLLGKRNIEVNIGDEYTELGYKASFFLKDLKDKVEVKSNVDTSKLGEYQVTYHLNYGMSHVVKKRTVTVVDKVKPEIQLTGEENVFVCPSGTYEEEGYKALDNYDGDITSKVKVTKNKDSIAYEVADSSNNQTKVIRKITYQDKEAPTILLDGDTEVMLYVGSSYHEPGYKAIDNCEGDITSKVTVTGEVNVNMVGEYPITYRVEDKSGNQQEIVRTVKVVKQDTSMKGVGKTIYLTFDDGPSSSITEEVLNILKEENVKATFFVINHDDSLNYLIKRAFDEGHTVALHSYTHDYSSVYRSVDAYFEDLYAIQNKVESITGKKSMIIRFPGGSSNTVSRRYQTGIMSILTLEVSKRGFTYFDWNVGSGDAGDARTKEEVYSNVVSGLNYQNNVVLMHDFENNYKTLYALRDIIRYGKDNNYTFKAITKETTPSHHRVNN